MPKNSVKLWSCCQCGESGMVVKSSTLCTTCGHYTCTYCEAYKGKNESTYSTSSYAEPPRQHSSGWGSSSYYAPAPQPATPQPAISTFPTLSDETPYQKQSVTSSKSGEVVEGTKPGDLDVVDTEQLEEAPSNETSYQVPSIAVSKSEDVKEKTQSEEAEVLDSQQVQEALSDEEPYREPSIATSKSEEVAEQTKSEKDLEPEQPQEAPAPPQSQMVRSAVQFQEAIRAAGLARLLGVAAQTAGSVSRKQEIAAQAARLEDEIINFGRLRSETSRSADRLAIERDLNTGIDKTAERSKTFDTQSAVEHPRLNEDPLDDYNAMSESKEHVRSRSDSISTSSFELVEKPIILVEDAGAPSGIEVPSSSNLRHRAGIQAPALQEPANVVDKGKGKAPQQSPSRDRDLERGPSQSSSSGTSKEHTPPTSENQHRENPNDPDPDEPASSTSSRLPKRSPLWLIWAIIICITLGLVALCVLIFALAHALTTETSPTSCATAKPRLGDPGFLFALQTCIWQIIAIFTGLMPACIHAHRYQKWMRMNVAWIAAVICLAIVIASVPLYVTSPAISTALASGSNAPLCVFIFFAAYEPYREERWKVEVEMRTPPTGRVENGVLGWERRDD